MEVSRTGDFFIRGADWGHATILQEVAAGQPRGIVLLPKEVTRKCVFQGYPTALPLDPVKEHPAVLTAERCIHNAGQGRRFPTHQVLLTLRGPVHASLNLSYYGRFDCKKFIPEPVRCFRCQASLPTPVQLKEGTVWSLQWGPRLEGLHPAPSR